MKKSNNSSNSHATIRKLIKTVLSQYRNLVKERFINRVSKLLFCKEKMSGKRELSCFEHWPNQPLSPCPALNVGILFFKNSSRHRSLYDNGTRNILAMPVIIHFVAEDRSFLIKNQNTKQDSYLFLTTFAGNLVQI